MKFTPEIRGILRRHMVEVPEVIQEASGIKIFGKRIRSLAFTTDVALDAEFKGAIGVVVNAPTPNDTIRAMRDSSGRIRNSVVA